MLIIDYVYFFILFRVAAFIVSLYYLVQLGEKLDIDNLGSSNRVITSAFSIPLLALFWLNSQKIYFKLFDHELKTQKKKI